MALRQLLISKKIEQRKNALAELLIQEEELQKRSETLEAAATEAQTDEELAVVEEEVGKLEAQKGELEQKKSKLQGEIAELEAELEQLNAKPPAENQRSAEPPAQQPVQQFEYRGESKMSIFRNLSRQERSQLVKRDDVREFLERARELAGQSQIRSVSGAELTIPDILLELIRDNLDRYSKLVNRVRLRRLRGTSRQNILGAIPEGIWMEAHGKLNELAIVFNQIEVDGYKVGGFIPVHNSDLEDSDENLAEIILDNISQAIGFALDKAILYGTGKKMPLGIVTRLAQTSKPDDWGPHAPDWTDLHSSHIVKINPSGKTEQEFFSELVLKLGSIPRANYTTTGQLWWAMNRKTKAVLMSKAVVFNAAGAIVAGVNNTMPVVGGDIIELDFIPDNDIIGGYGELYRLVERKGGTFARSEHVRFIEDQTVFKGTARYDGKPIFGEAFVVVNINNQDPTTTIPFAPDTANPQDAYLKELKIGNKTLSPSFDPATLNYTCTTTDASNTVTATPVKSGASVKITHKGGDHNSGDTLTWDSGDNDVTITVKFGTTTVVYNVVVTKS